MRPRRVAWDFTQQQCRVSRRADVVARFSETLSSPCFSRTRKPDVINRGDGRGSAGTDGTSMAIMEFFYERKNNLFCAQSLN
jgi:hypothetical protein